MPSDLEPLLHHVRRLAAPPESDAALLRRFSRCRDETAFADLAARHGPMVLRVCRRVLGDPHAAEDAFQATFLVLARRAGDVRRPEALAGWLYGVALRVARKARQAGLRRPKQVIGDDDGPPASIRDPLDDLTARELLDGLDEEVQRLPAAYRLPVILCCLEGLSQGEAARRLGWSPGSVKGRLERGRATLHARLVRRGLTLTAALAAVEASRTGAAALPALAGAGTLAAAGATTFPWKAAAPLALAVLLAGAGVGLLAARGPGGAPARPQAAAPPVPSAGPEDAPHNADDKGDQTRSDKDLIQGTWDIVSWANGGMNAPADVVGKMQLVFTADTMITRRKDTNEDTLGLRYTLDPTKNPKEIDTSHEIDAGKPFVQFGIYSLEEDTLKLCLAAAGAPRPTKLESRAADGSTLFVLNRAGADRRRGQAIPVQGGVGAPVVFSPDGTRLVGGDDKTLCIWGARTGKFRQAKDVPGGSRNLLYHPSGGRLFHISDGILGPRYCPDSSWLAGVPTGPAPTELRDAETGEVVRTLEGVKGARGDGDVWLWDMATGKALRPLEDSAGAPSAYVFSPDSKTIAGVTHEGNAALWDVATGKATLILGGAWWQCVAFSPDGHTLAAGGRDVGHAAEADGVLRVWNAPDGKELLTVREVHHTGVVTVAFSPDGKRLITAGKGPHGRRAAELIPVSFDGEVKVWDAQTGKQLLAFATNVGDLDWALVSPDGTRILVNRGWDGKGEALWSLDGDD